jgi:hypothetical protein
MRDLLVMKALTVDMHRQLHFMPVVSADMQPPNDVEPISVKSSTSRANIPSLPDASHCTLGVALVDHLLHIRILAMLEGYSNASECSSIIRRVPSFMTGSAGHSTLAPHLFIYFVEV